MLFWRIVFIGFLIVSIGIVVYWQLVIAEGTYLGQQVVTFLYDLTADKYNSIKQFDNSAEDYFLGRPLVSEFARLGGPLVLDVGTGTARLPLALFRQPTFQGKVIGIDHSLRMLKVASTALATSRSRCAFVHTDGLQLPFPVESFSAVTCLEMLEFTPSPVRQLRELARVLQAGGILLTTRRRGFDALLIPGKTYSVDDFRRMLTELGLVDIRLERWQVDYDLVWARKPGTTPANRASNYLEVLLCPSCNQPSFEENKVSLVCTTCGQIVSVENNIVRLI